MNWLRKILSYDSLMAEIAMLRNELCAVKLDVLQPQFQIAPQYAPWTVEDGAALRAFYQTPTGARLIEICGGQTLQTAMKEAQGDAGTPTAAGMDALLRFQFNLASDEQLKRISGATAAQVAKNTGTDLNESATETVVRSF